MAHALALVVDDDGGAALAAAVMAELNFLVAQVNGGFVASAGEAEGVVFFDFPDGLGVEEFVAVFGGRRKRTRARSMPKRSMGFMPRASWGMAL